MKTSNKILLGGLIVLLLAITVLVVISSNQFKQMHQQVNTEQREEMRE